MFHLDGGGGVIAEYDSSLNKEESFACGRNDREIAKLSRSDDDGDNRSSRWSASLLSCIISDDSENCNLTQDLPKQKNENDQKIELSLFNRKDLKIDLIKINAEERDGSITIVNNKCNIRKASKFKAVCYTPERLIRCQEYRILAPSPFCFTYSQTKFILCNESSWTFRRYRKQLNNLIDPQHVGARQLKKILCLPIENVGTHAVSSLISENTQHADDFDTPEKNNLIFDQTSSDGQLPSAKTILTMFGSNKSSYNCKKPFLEKISNIRSNDSNLDMQKEQRTSPMCLYDEMVIASQNSSTILSNDHNISINEVTSILENLESHPEKAMVLLDEDRFCDCISFHDQLTRLALTIEADAENPAALNDLKHSVHYLRDRIERLQLANKEIYRDIRHLHAGFQCDEKKIMKLSYDTTKMHQEIHETQYLDDLLKLLQGKFKSISKRSWPFRLKHRKVPREEINLII